MPCRELGRQHLHDDFAPEPMLVGDEDARHAAAAELALERVAAAEGRLELIAEFARLNSVGGKEDARMYGFGKPRSSSTSISRESRHLVWRSILLTFE